MILWIPKGEKRDGGPEKNCFRRVLNQPENVLGMFSGKGSNLRKGVTRCIVITLDKFLPKGNAVGVGS